MMHRIEEDRDGDRDIDNGNNNADEPSDCVTNSEADANDDDDEYDYDDESYESEEDDGSGRTLLFLCEEGQLDTALKRVREWDERFPLPETSTTTTRTTTKECAPPPYWSSSTAKEATTEAAADFDAVTIQRELFRKNPTTGNYCLHEILAGGTSGTSAPELVDRLVQRYRSQGTTPTAIVKYQTIFKAQPTIGSNGRTILHWCAWSKTSPKILRLVLEAYPDAMCLRDNKSHLSRTPLEIAQRYWPDDEITKILKSSLETYLPYRIRVCVRLCVEQLFVLPRDKRIKTRNVTNSDTSKDDTPPQNTFERKHTTLKPFDKKDRKIAGLAPRPWFAASVLGYALQREMKGLALQIASFMGYGAKLETTRRFQKRNRLYRKRKQR
jgi:hypothetical protein